MSTIKVYTIQTRGGASEIAIDKLKGGSSASSISVVAEGGSTTTNLQQGLNKVWANLNGSSFGLRDNFNVTSATDNGTGDHTITIANNMGNANYSLATNGGDINASALGTQGLYTATAPASDSVRIGSTASDGSQLDFSYFMIQIAGDLA